MRIDGTAAISPSRRNLARASWIDSKGKFLSARRMRTAPRLRALSSYRTHPMKLPRNYRPAEITIPMRGTVPIAPRSRSCRSGFYVTRARRSSRGKKKKEQSPTTTSLARALLSGTLLIDPSDVAYVLTSKRPNKHTTD